MDHIKMKQIKDTSVDETFVLESEIRSYKVAMIQMKVVGCKQTNINKAKSLIDDMYHQIGNDESKKPLVIGLPEFFNWIGDMNDKQTAEEDDCKGPTLQMLSGLARQYSVHIVSGSIMERDSTVSPPKYYNTSFIFGPDGRLVDKFRKMYLYDSKLWFQESSYFTAGDRPCIVDLGKGIKIGVGICHDIRHSELSDYYSSNKCSLVLYPICFNSDNVETMLDLLFRSRAFDSYIYTVGVNSARGGLCWNPTYEVGGNSLCCGPAGEIIDRMGTEEGHLITTIDLDKIQYMYDDCPVPLRKKQVKAQPQYSTSSRISIPSSHATVYSA
ncbi:hypothetical protein DFA_06111 [Cavenderia fasciculata]|uniref:CN hydrolase domain-containing protein n=1 Tax=Cavenderia fasciculata TaxID=261658 RepID=F4PK49_CACFS|nr:uncharacterized protein DFA_06111 [Cavenderia fasciculata]EGG23973.1 hypothetical protein DFA_06111 [Cavenderia fasciculata]|eukprot:XP_004361824.1 hypothetical protein DFA_06111 [Cavenderia fasciculata]